MRRTFPLRFYKSPSHPCCYLPDREATTLLADPATPMDTRTYSVLIDHGFRRSGKFVYRPDCSRCNSCIPVRVPVAEFQPRRSQRRVWRSNQDLRVQAVPTAYNAEHYRLYHRYMAQRHPNHGMDLLGSPDEEPYKQSYRELLNTPEGLDTRLYEVRLDETLLAVMVTDHLQQGLSAVYTLFAPENSSRSLGVYAILWQICEAQRLKLPWLYLGFWIAECRKMSYKSQYRPLEIYRNQQWWRLEQFQQ